MTSTINIYDQPQLRDRLRVFRNRAHAGTVLATMLESSYEMRARIFAIPAGGVPVAAVIAESLELPLDIAVVSKITFPWNSEAGYGAVAFDGTVRLNDKLLSQCRLSEHTIQEGIEKTLNKVRRRVKEFYGQQECSQVLQHPVIVVDDGIASGFTLHVAVEALRNMGAHYITIAVPTGHEDAVHRIAQEVEAVYCANLRGGWVFAVADAYEQWSDVDEEEAIEIYKRLSMGNAPPH
jgi:putative phosphoribosyl transferase